LLLSVSTPLPVLALPPAAHDDEMEAWEDSDDSANHFDVLANDEPFPGVPFVIVGVTPGTAQGQVSIIGGGSLVSYQPAPDFYGTETFTYTAHDGFGGNHTATVTVTVNAINDRPDVADDHVTTYEDTRLVIDVLANDHDKDGELDPGTVRTAEPSHGDIIDIDSVTGLITYEPDDNWNGEDVFIYSACDDGSPPPVLCDQADVYVTVQSVPDPPIADAGPDQSVPTLSKVTLDGSGSHDPDGDDVKLTYLWQQTGGTQQVTLSDITAQSPTFLAPDNPEVLEFTLRVVDEDSNSTSDTVNVTVTNQSPVADAGPDQDVLTESTVTLNGSGSYDPDDDPLTFEWTQTSGPRVALDSTTPAKPTFTAPSTASRLVFSLRVRDKFGAWSPADETVVNVNEAPVYMLYMPFVVTKHAILPDLVVQTINATSNNVRVVIKNQGSAAVTDGFYVDVYINPKRAPVSANEGWDTPGISTGRGLVWAIQIGPTTNLAQGILAPLAPGETLTLNVGDGFYQPEYSSMSWPLGAGTPIYAQVDSYPAPSPHNGLVLENHEAVGLPYNNITGPVSSTGVTSSATAPLPAPSKPTTLRGLRPRP
jgi:hypothetical protein